MILDGWGEGRHDHSNAIYTAGAPFIDSLRAKYPMSHLQTCGEAVGLPDGQMGNSEVGHMNLGAGRVVYQDLMKINKTCREHKLLTRAEIKGVYDYVKQTGKKLHLMGLCSTGGVHSSLDHYYEFLNVAKEYGLDNVFVHCFMDGRDTDPHSGKGFVADLEKHMAESTGKVASVCGRFYAMDRDKRWNRVKEAYDLLVNGQGAAFTSATDGIQASYDADVTDEFIKPIVITDAAGAPLAKIEEGDAIIFMNFRNDRAREITAVLTQQDMPEEGMHIIPNLYYCCMTPYDAAFKGLHILFDKEIVKDTLGEIVSKAGLHQLRIAETEKYAHVTFFFNGGRETPFENEDRILVPSPKVPTYDLQPEMSAPIVTEKLIEAIDTDKEDLRKPNNGVCFFIGWGYTYMQEHLFSDAWTSKMVMSDHIWTETNNYYSAGTAISANCKNPERAMMVLNLVNTDPFVATLMRFGVGETLVSPFWSIWQIVWRRGHEH